MARLFKQAGTNSCWETVVRKGDMTDGLGVTRGMFKLLVICFSQAPLVNMRISEAWHYLNMNLDKLM
uniref:Uncharacterized protein n=1 Tax=Kalanchoe fedtschenkoi TaxID=63787 RepID=A0A7N0TSK0_KALFE